MFIATGVTGPAAGVASEPAALLGVDVAAAELPAAFVVTGVLVASFPEPPSGDSELQAANRQTNAAQSRGHCGFRRRVVMHGTMP
ncbi:MAG TPA: hypothetical protein VJR89_23000, partial [Polyangiales bacterium]|nr:hypothetical protein [Polyangiales bacterium]